MSAYAELVAASHFSFLRGASSPMDLVTHAIRLGLTAIGIADRNTVAGVVRAHKTLKDAPEAARSAILEQKKAAKQPLVLTAEEDAACADISKLRLLVGARLVFADGTPDIVAYPQTRYGWGRLTRLLTVGNMRATKGSCILNYADLLDYMDEIQFIVMPASTATEQEEHRRPLDYLFDEATEPPAAVSHLRLVENRPKGLEAVLADLSRRAPQRVWLGISLPRRGDDLRRLARHKRIAARAGVPLLATNDVLYVEPANRPLQDVLTCIRHGTTIMKAGRALEANAERHLKSGAEMRRLFGSFPEAIDATLNFIAGVSFTLNDLSYQYPHEPVPQGWTPQDWLEHLVSKAAREFYGDPVPDKVQSLIDKEFSLVRQEKYAYYFLTVHDLVAFARAQNPPILCQGRGSAANSIICFLLGVTSVDPFEHNLLFSRFISEDRKEPPDIDVDFEHERREEVMQYVYRRYGRHRAGIVATVIHYRSRSAVREVAKVLGLSEDIAQRLVGTVWGSHSGDMGARLIREAGFDPDNPQIAQLRSIIEPLLSQPFPRHLSQHVGGFVLTENRLDETVPIHHAAMEDRSFIEWDKDDIDTLNLMKVDVLALGMLTCIQKSFELMREHDLGDHTLTVDLKSDDDEVYAMLKRGDSVGVFQVESRAQMNMLPHLKPKNLYDLSVQVAIVRPGPIEGDMVHPYLRRRAGIEKWSFPKPSKEYDQDELEALLGKTFGVPLFQEQAMKLAIVAAGFSDADANRLRRAMATFRNLGTISQLKTKLIEGMVYRGYEREFAERCYRQIEGFGSYGFPESHALSFARLVYVSAWIKCHQPAVFACALLNSQPMGFYAPAQIVRDALEHGVDIRPIDINASRHDNHLERNEADKLALRLGFRQMDGFRKEWSERLVDARLQAPFDSVETLARRARLPQRGLRLLADADAFGSIELSRRDALWDVRRTPDIELPLFASAKASELGTEEDMALPDMADAEEVATDYQTTRLSLKGHPMEFLRPLLRKEGVHSSGEVMMARNGQVLRMAGIVLVRQRPGKGNAIFVTLEDEFGITNVLIWARLFETMRRPIMASRLMQVEGKVQRSREGVLHVMGTKVLDRTALLDQLTEASPSSVIPLAATHPRDVRILPKSRDFH